METDCKPNCDSILKKAKWLIIAAYVWEICLNLIYSLGIPWILFYVLNDTENKHQYLVYITSVFGIISHLLYLVAYLYLRKCPNKVFKQTANILLLTFLSVIIFGSLIPYLLETFFKIQPLSTNLILGIIWTYLYIIAYGNLLKDPVIKKMYIPSIYLLCLGTIILRFINIPYEVLYTITSGSPLQNVMTNFSQVNNIAGLLLGLTAFILIIFGWKQLLSTPSQIPTTTSDTRISLKPTKVEYGYLVSCGVLIALLFIYFNSVSLDIFSK